MICKSCNTEVKEGAIFCACCGSKIVYENTVTHDKAAKEVKPVINVNPVKPVANAGANPRVQVNQTPVAIPMEEKGKKSKASKKRVGWTIFGMISAGIVGAAASACVMYMTNPYVTWTRILEQESFSSAIDYYMDNREDLSETEVTAINENTVSAASDIVDQYKNREIDYAVAVNQLEKMKQVEDLEEDVEKLMSTIEKINISRSDFNTAEKLFSEDKYIEAKEYYDKVVAEDEDNYKEAQEKIATCIEKYREETLAKIESLEKEKKFEEALAVAQNGLKVLKNDEQLLTKSNELSSTIEENDKQELLASVKEKQSAKKYAEAIKELKNYSGNDEEILALEKQLIEAYEKEVVDQVETALSEGNVEVAKKKINEAKAVVSTSEKINQWAAEIDSYIPVSLSEFETFASEKNNKIDKDKWENGHDYDNIGNTYEDGFTYRCSAYSTTESVSDTYLVEGKYNKFTGTWVTTKEAKDRTDSKYFAKVYVYGDGVCLYSSPVARGAVYPQDFEVDITNVNELTIKVEMHGQYMDAGLVNPRLSKTLAE